MRLAPRQDLPLRRNRDVEQVSAWPGWYKVLNGDGGWWASSEKTGRCPERSEKAKEKKGYLINFPPMNNPVMIPLPSFRRETSTRNSLALREDSTALPFPSSTK